jgi:hypothetical protein
MWAGSAGLVIPGRNTKKGFSVMKSGLTGLFAAAVIASTAPAPAQSYNVTDLGAVSGQKVSKG